MSADILIGNKVILKTSSGVFETLYYELRDIIDDKKDFISSEIEEFIDIMEVYKQGGCYFYIDKYITTSKGVSELLNLMKQAIMQLKNQFPQSVISSLMAFCQDLQQYGDNLAKYAK